MRLLLLIPLPLLLSHAQPPPRLLEWERGIALEAPDQPGMTMYLWFYEWNMFEAMAPGQHTHGTFRMERSFDPAGRSAVLRSSALELKAEAAPGGAALTLRVRNLTPYPWPPIAGIIPCWSPGRVEGTDPSRPVPKNRAMADSERKRTYFLSAAGLTALSNREIHFHRALRPLIERASQGGRFVFSEKWPTSAVDAVAGLLLRESEPGGWVTGVAWQDYLSVQGHNPWSCMHVAVRVGPLEPGQSKVIRGRLYLFRGDRNDGLRRFRRDLGGRP